MVDASQFIERGKSLATKGSMIGLMLIATSCAKPPSSFAVPHQSTGEIVRSLDASEPVPTDILEKDFHTFIHNLPDIQLQVMPTALLEDPTFRKIRKSAEKPQELHIVLMNGSYVGSEFLPDDLPEGDRKKLKEILDRSNLIYTFKAQAYFETNKEWAETALQNEIDGINEAFEKGEYSQKDHDEMIRLITEYFEPYFGDIKPEDLFNTVGHFEPLDISQQPDNIQRAYILLATRESPRSIIHRKYLELRYPSGITAQERSNIPPDWDLLLNPLDSHRDIRSLKVDPESQKYPITDPDIGITLRHELGHNIGLEHPQNDWTTLLQLKRAWERYHIGEAWERHEKGDPSGYYFRFRTPAGDIY